MAQRVPRIPAIWRYRSLNDNALEVCQDLGYTTINQRMIEELK